ncbi:MAG: ABC transporter permease [Oscillospiraceae bacterium]|nr:ABC transporter permease [Oscillospiraceae bacterium]
MAQYLIKRILTAVPVFFGITLAVFLMLQAAPGTAADLAGAGEFTSADQQAVEAALGLDQPLPIRYLRWLSGLLRFDLGRSFQSGRAVMPVIAQRIAPSLLLTGTGVLLAVAAALPLGVLSACRPHGLLDRVSTAVAFAGSGLPGFFVSLLAVYFFAVRLRLLPASGMYTAGGSGTVGDLLRHLVLPACVIALSNFGSLLKQTRSACMEVFSEPFMQSARSRGIGAWAVVVRHGFRNALPPVLTTVLGHIPHLIGGSMVVECIFGWPGMGSLMLAAIRSRDYAIAMGVTVLVALAVLGANLLLDVLYGIADPRVSYTRSGQ